MSSHSSPDTETEHLSKDTVFSLLSNQRRRYTLQYLGHHSNAVSLRDLAAQVAAWENDVALDDLEYKQRKRVSTALHQTHLPKLHEAGVVDYDRDAGTVTLADRAADLDAYLELVGEHDVPWCALYLGLSTVAAVCIAAASAGLTPFASLPSLSLAGGLIAAFLVAAGVNARLARRHHLGRGDDGPA
ncbi:hypothetical protein SAMN04488065_2026 [Haloplanus vescus]|uniref:DUF7344 domain-containing protein n=1 Tax=Haloplanus vescus TaxID=555874 RepID=A0A1H3YR64_9EURY|nr:hypothetical protein [Haloplanus vescus]SEA13504.1 hypothetical protein SAMN04488065_2026 [Haloplanus vescus]